MQRTLYSLTASFIPIPATMFSRRVQIQEDGSADSVGIQLKFPDDNYTQAFTYLADKQPVILGNVIAGGHGEGPMVGYPEQSANTLTPRAATVLVMAAALTGTTKIIVEEID